MMHIGEINCEGMMALVVKTGRFYSHVYLKMYLHLCIKIFFCSINMLRNKHERRHILC